MKMKIYLSGPITGMKDDNRPAFTRAQAELERLGHEVVNPLEVPVTVTDPAKGWQAYMKADIRAMMGCDAIAVLPHWAKSRGASLEVYIATQVGMELIYLGAKYWS